MSCLFIAIAAIIAHEATHADYAYNPEAAITETLTRHPELTRDDLNIERDSEGNEVTENIFDPETNSIVTQVVLGNSLDQEYSSFANELELWQEIKGTDTSIFHDRDLALYLQGEATLKAELRTLYADQDLPEY